jgi:Flp pilus assembly protein CpaB
LVVKEDSRLFCLSVGLLLTIVGKDQRESIYKRAKKVYISLSLRNNHQTKEEEVQDLQHHLSQPHLFLTLQKGKKEL